MFEFVNFVYVLVPDKGQIMKNEYIYAGIVRARNHFNIRL